MAVVIALLRGINVGGKCVIRMAELKELCEGLGLSDVRSYIQSGNLVFRTRTTRLAPLAARMEAAIEARFGFRPRVLLRTAGELRRVVDTNPFAGRPGLDPARLMVMFLASDAATGWEDAVKSRARNEEWRLAGHELFLYFPDGMGKSKVAAVLEKALKTGATARNWATILKLMAMAES